MVDNFLTKEGNNASSKCVEDSGFPWQALFVCCFCCRSTFKDYQVLISS